MRSEPESRSDPSIDDLLADWNERWLPSLAQQVHDMHHRRQLHDEFMTMLEASGHRDRDVFTDFFHRMYVEAQALAIRRQADEDARTLSLRRLIGQLFQHRKLFTRSWYVRRWVGTRNPNASDERERIEARMHVQFANDAFDRFTDRPGARSLGGRRLQDDLKALSDVSEGVVSYVNEHVAHVASSPDTPVSYAEFHRAMDHLGEMLKRYYLLIDQGGLVSATPVIQGDWKGPFRRPLA